MATKKEKQLTIQLLKERIERLTGKKVTFKEGPSSKPHQSAFQPDDFKGAVIELVYFSTDYKGWCVATDKGSFIIDKKLNFTTSN